MKSRMRVFLASLALFPLALLAGCESGSEQTLGSEPPPAETATKLAEAPRAAEDRGAAATEPARAVKIEKETDTFTFAYGYPAKATAISGLDAMFRQRAAAVQSDIAKDAASFRVEAKEGGFNFNPYSYEGEWTVVADVPGYLSLLLEFYAYSGGAHGMTGFDSLVWDRKSDKALEPLAMFASPAEFTASFRKAFCDGLNAARRKRRGGTDLGEMFGDCPDASEQTLILGSTGGGRFDRIGIMIGPYVAGPYAEGSYEVTLPMTSAMLATVKPEHKDAFAAGR